MSKLVLFCHVQRKNNVKLQVCNNKKELKLMLARKFVNYRLPTYGRDNTKQAEMPYFIMVPQERKNFSQIRSK